MLILQLPYHLGCFDYMTPTLMSLYVFSNAFVHARASDFYNPGMAHHAHIARYLYAHCIYERCSQLCTHGGSTCLSAILFPSSVLIDIMIVHFQVGGRRQHCLNFTTIAPLLPSSSPQKGSRQNVRATRFRYCFCHLPFSYSGLNGTSLKRRLHVGGK